METMTLADAAPSQTAPQIWSPLQCIAFRFCVVYFGLYCLLSQIINSVLTIPKVDAGPGPVGLVD
jgi:hypothetical protein